MYSKREGTKAARFPDDVSLEVKKERLRRLIDFQNRITKEKNEQLVGKEVEILIEGKSRRDNLPMGKTRTGKEVIIKMQNEKCRMKNVKVGEFVNVFVESISGWTGIGVKSTLTPVA
jgi:tRNA-2-methylthio-N6-dimethylallyladenosine synthase